MLRNESELMGSSKTLIFLISITLVGFFLRIHYLHNDIPLVLDGLQYFFLGMDISILGNLPIGYDKTNIGWPLFLSIIFAFLSSIALCITCFCLRLATKLELIPSRND